MNKFKDFFTTKGFYIALTIGVVAFAILTGVYEYRTNSDKFKSPEVDLNQPYIEGSANGDAAKNINSSNEIKAKVTTEEPKPETQLQDVAKENEPSEETPATSDDVENVQTHKDNGDDKVHEVIGYNGDASLAWPLVSRTDVAGNTDAAEGGAIVIPYSMDTTVYFETLGVYKCNPGVMLRGTEGENVYAVYSGTVTEVRDTKEYGTVVTIDMGNGYEAKYGQLMNVCVKEGSSVATGQNIAEVAAVSDYYTKEGTNLYLSITKDGIPVNPISLIE